MERIIKSPVGNLLLKTDGEYLTDLEFTKEKVSNKDKSPTLDLAEKELNEYFSGVRKEFTVKVKQNGTDFQNRVWLELMKIPYGETISYGELANRVGSPNAHRACGTANGKNHVAIIVPCHRVINKDNTLGGYSGGIGIKDALLELEKVKFKANK